MADNSPLMGSLVDKNQMDKHVLSLDDASFTVETKTAKITGGGVTKFRM